MKTIILGGGKGCRSILSLARGSFLKEFKIDITAVVDINNDAPGMVFARSIGLKTYTSIDKALNENEVELVIELTGSDEIVKKLYSIVTPGTYVMEHSIMHIFYDLLNAQEEKKMQLKALEELEDRIVKKNHFLQALFDSNNDLVVVMDKDLTIIKANSAFCEFAGMSQEEVIGKTCYEALGHTPLNCNKEENEEIIKQVFESGKPQTIIRMTPPPNETHWEIIRSPIRNEDGEIFAVFATWHKITERVLLEREVESQELRFRSFINSAQDWISIKDLEGRYVIANPVTADAFNLKPEDFEGKKPEELLPPKLAKTVKMHDKNVIESHKHQTFEEIIPVKGQDHHFQTVRFPLTNYRNEIIGVCTIARDITKEIKLQEQLVQNEKLAALGKLAAGVAHEINNPLTGILAYAEDMLEEVEEGSVFKDDLSVIIRETLRCRDIVRNLLDFARQDTPSFQIINPNEIVSSSLALIERLPQFKDIKINVNREDNIPNIKADPKQMQQVILNLLINAADAMNYKGSIFIFTQYDFKNDKCILSVEDTGPGIPENLIDKIFEPFFSTKTTSGLGLAVSWGIIERHNGTIEVDMADRGGAVFRLVLPAVK